MYAILLSHGEEQIKCKDCDGEGSLDIRGSLKTCRFCGGLGRVMAFDEAHRVLRGFRLPEDYTVTLRHSVQLMFSGFDLADVVSGFDVDEVIHSLFALSVSGIKARIIYPVM